MLGSVAQQLLSHGFTAFAYLCGEVFAFHALETVECAGKHKVVEYSAVDSRSRHTLHEVVDVLEASAFLSCLDDIAHHIGTYTFDCRQPETYHSRLGYTESRV